MKFKFTQCIMLLSLSSSFTHAAVNEERLEELLSLDGKIESVGPNCVSSVFYTSDLVDDYSYIAISSLAPVLDSKHCKEIPAEDRNTGDFVMVYGEAYRYNEYVPHVALLTEKNKGFSKMGFEATTEAKVIQNTELKLNPGGHIPTECLGTLESSEDFNRCLELATARYFRCDIPSLKTQLSQRQSFREILDLRATLLGSSPESLQNAQNKSDSLAERLISEQETRFPDHPIASAANAKRLDTFLVGFRIESYLFESIRELPEEFKLILIEAALINSLNTQIKFLTEQE